MAINIKTEQEIEIMREGGKILGTILAELEPMVKVGVDSYDLEEKFIELCNKFDVIPACKGYTVGNLGPFPTGLCIGFNEDAVHCFAKKGKIIKDGDLVNVDTVIKYKGMHLDSAFTVGVGNVSKDNYKLLNTAQLALDVAINNANAGSRVGDISNAIQTICEMAGFNVIRGYTGHGIGKSMHEEPNVPCYGKKGTGPDLVPGMTLAIEPLVCVGDYKIVSKAPNSWETKMADGRNFIQFEHTVLITENGPEILTSRP